MAYVIYEARRSLAPGHVAAVSYTLPLILTRADRRVDADVRRQRSLSGRTETLYYGSVITFDVGIAPVRFDLLPLHREFLDSTLDGQTFTLNVTSSLESDELSVIRDDEGWGEVRFLQSTIGDRYDLFTYQFKARVV